MSVDVADETGTIRASFYGTPGIARHLHRNRSILVRGKRNGFGLQVHDHSLDGDAQTDPLTPVYAACSGMSVKELRSLIRGVLPLAEGVSEPLPAELLDRLALAVWADALLWLHRPPSLGQAEQARRRLAFEELLHFQVGWQRRKGEDGGDAIALDLPETLPADFREVLPFVLTAGQEQAIEQIERDIACSAPMERLLQGDVGSGKTVVALFALVAAALAGHQAAFMAPTETLAEQHLVTIKPIAETLGVRCELLTSSAERPDEVRLAISQGEPLIVVGTHALIQDGVRFASLAVAVIDEQHRFGVAQRQALSAGDPCPHQLNLSATPIPRTLALALYGEVHVSEIEMLPEGRQPIVTHWRFDEDLDASYERLRHYLGEGQQAYVVCSRINPNDDEGLHNIDEELGRLVRALPGLRVASLHGRLPAQERRRIMASFVAHELDVLVATTVIEVGVDVPNATVIFILDADRYGLAQLHQLRGRVGRGTARSHCLLVSKPEDELTEIACERLEALMTTEDGFRLAERDLELRGPGEFLGTQQTGDFDLAFTRISADGDLIRESRSLATELLNG